MSGRYRGNAYGDRAHVPDATRTNLGRAAATLAADLTPARRERKDTPLKHLLVYYGGAMASTPEARAEGLKAWDAWFKDLGTAVVDGGNPFTGKVKSVSADGAIGDGPIARIASGYSILEAGSIDEAAKMAAGCPVLKSGGQIAVYETVNAM